LPHLTLPRQVSGRPVLWQRRRRGPRRLAEERRADEDAQGCARALIEVFGGAEFKTFGASGSLLLYGRAVKIRVKRSVPGPQKSPPVPPDALRPPAPLCADRCATCAKGGKVRRSTYELDRSRLPVELQYVSAEKHAHKVAPHGHALKYTLCAASVHTHVRGARQAPWSRYGGPPLARGSSRCSLLRSEVRGRGPYSN